MEKVHIDTLIALLSKAKDTGCTNVKLQLYDNWEAIAKEQRSPSHPAEDYMIDTRYYNTIDFETEVINSETSDRIETQVVKDTLIIKVSISDRDSLLYNLGIIDSSN